MQNAVDLEQLKKARAQIKRQNRANMYSLAASILVKNSETVINGDVSEEDLVKESLSLAKEFYQEVTKLEEEEMKKETEVTDDGSNGKIVTG